MAQAREATAFIAVMLCELVILATLFFIPYWLFSMTVADIIFWGGLIALTGWFAYWTRSRDQNGQPRPAAVGAIPFRADWGEILTSFLNAVSLLVHRERASDTGRECRKQGRAQLRRQRAGALIRSAWR